MSHQSILATAGFTEAELSRGGLAVHTPIDGSQIASLEIHDTNEVETMIRVGVEAFEAWRVVPAPRRGELVRLLGEALREE